MLDKIKKIDMKENPTPSGHNRFYTYFTKYRNELCAVTVAVRNYYKKWYCKQIVVHGIHTDKVYLRDIEQCMGFIVIGWYREKITQSFRITANNYITTPNKCNRYKYAT